MKKYLSRLLALILALLLLAAPASALTVDQALELLEKWYYYDIPDEAYDAETMEELMGLLSDPYTSYMSPEAYEAYLAALEGDSNVVGIGVTIQYTDRGILVVETISGGSAREAGLQPGDLIVEVNGVSCVPADSSCGDLLTGGEGTTVSITVLRGDRTAAYTLTRRPVIIPNTEIRLLDGGIGLIDCNSFGQNTGREFADLIRENDAAVSAWVVDLRDNGGGYVDAAVDMINALAGPGRYVYFEFGDGAVEASGGTGAAGTKKPVIVLTNGASASASEMVASNVRDMGRGVTVGGRTYGKGVAQGMLDKDYLPDYFADGDSLKITIYRFYSAGKNTTDRIGVIPTLLVDDDKVLDVALALCGGREEAGAAVRLGSQTCYLAPGTDKATLSALFAALPPQAAAYYSPAPGRFEPCSIAEAAERLGVEYASRWFTDTADSGYADAINAMGTYGLLNGVGGGRFNPEGRLTRAQLCAMLAQVLDVAYRGATLFDDVSQDSWYGPSVNAMAYLGLVDGVGGGRFNPGGTVTQEQFLTIMGRMARFINLELDSYGQWLSEKDSRFTLSQRAALAPYSGWAKNSVAVLAWGLEEALEAEGEDMLFAPLEELSPKAPILREEAAAGMYAVLAGLNLLP